MHILFPSDGEMYAWREAIYLRSGLSSVIGSPTNVVHAIHVSYDKESGELKVRICIHMSLLTGSVRRIFSIFFDVPTYRCSRR